MMLHLIASRHGRALAEVVANGLVSGRIRHDSESQRATADDTLGVVNQRLAGIVHAMEAHLETPLTTEALALRAGVSVRQIERLMRETLGETPSRYYLKLRLQAARNHLFYGDMPIQEISRACGFSSPVGAVARLPAALRRQPARVPQAILGRPAGTLPAGAATAAGGAGERGLAATPSIQIHPDRLGLGVLVHRLGAVVAGERARALVAAERRLHVALREGVDRDRAAGKRARHPERLGDVAREDRGVEAVLRCRGRCAPPRRRP